jgi:hypothetical protein
VSTLLEEFCFVKDNALDDRVCDDLVRIFRENPQLHERYDNVGKPNFTQLNFTQNRELADVIHSYMVQSSVLLLEEYKTKVPETAFWPKKYGFEEFRIKHYKEGGEDRFDMHVDAISTTTAKRFFAFFWYINDVQEGGYTYFPQISKHIEPKKRRAFMFPPLWTYPHAGEPVIKGEKFLISSYLHYAD